MAQALLLGAPMHGRMWPVDDEKEKIEVQVEVETEQRGMSGCGGIGFTPHREVTATYVRLPLNGGPPEAIVYREENYIPQPEDEEAVLQAFG